MIYIYSIEEWDRIVECSETARNTFLYIFHKIKKGIYIRIRANVMLFVVFNNTLFKNEWFHLLGTNTHVSDQTTQVHPVERWFANNALIRYENPFNEKNKDLNIIYDMFTELTNTHLLHDVEFFVNKRDFPILTIDGTEPYDYIWGRGHPLVSYMYDTYSPILSMCSSPRYQDTPIPNWEDWAHISPTKYPEIVYKYVGEWQSIPYLGKKDVAVFRGASTGIEWVHNQRIKLCRLAKTYPDIDAGITSWNTRPRIINGKLISPSIPTDHIALEAQKLTLKEMSTYRYIIHIDGHVCAFRLLNELYSGSVILKVSSQTDHKLWYSDLLQPYVHFVPVDPDLTDIHTQITWCRVNVDKCIKIAQNARDLHDRIATKHTMLLYIKNILNTIPPLNIERLKSPRIVTPPFGFTSKKTSGIPYRNFTKTFQWDIHTFITHLSIIACIIDNGIESSGFNINFTSYDSVDNVVMYKATSDKELVFKTISGLRVFHVKKDEYYPQLLTTGYESYYTPHGFMSSTSNRICTISNTGGFYRLLVDLLRHIMAQQNRVFNKDELSYLFKITQMLHPLDDIKTVKMLKKYIRCLTTPSINLDTLWFWYQFISEKSTSRLEPYSQKVQVSEALSGYPHAIKLLMRLINEKHIGFDRVAIYKIIIENTTTRLQ